MTFEIHYDPEDPNTFRTRYFSHEVGIMFKGVLAVIIGVWVRRFVLR